MISGQGWYEKGADWWALGVVTYELIHGEGPFLAASIEGVYSRSANLGLLYDADLKHSCLAFLRSMPSNHWCGIQATSDESFASRSADVSVPFGAQSKLM